jgi:hypothetical protein
MNESVGSDRQNDVIDAPHRSHSREPSVLSIYCFPRCPILAEIGSIKIRRPTKTAKYAAQAHRPGAGLEERSQ